MNTRIALPLSTPARATLFALVFAAAALTGCASTMPVANAAASPDDARLAAEVKAALTQAWQLKNADIAVSAAHGQVHLAGWVGYPEDVQLAERLAEHVSGVAKVDANFHTWSTSER